MNELYSLAVLLRRTHHLHRPVAPRQHRADHRHHRVPGALAGIGRSLPVGCPAQAVAQSLERVSDGPERSTDGLVFARGARYNPAVRYFQATPTPRQQCRGVFLSASLAKLEEPWNSSRKKDAVSAALRTGIGDHESTAGRRERTHFSLRDISSTRQPSPYAYRIGAQPITTSGSVGNELLVLCIFGTERPSKR